MFLIRLPPLTHESLSSWRLRNGFENGFKTLARPKGAPHLIDPDTYPKKEEEKWLTQNLLRNPEDLWLLTLDYINASISKSQNASRTTRWILSAGNGSNTSSAGPVVCPQCLKGDSPYFRLGWRYAFSTYCDQHQCLLIDRCPTCEQRMWPYRYYESDRKYQVQIGFCHHCGADLHNPVPSPYVDALAINAWDWIFTNSVPKNYSCTTELSDFFDALWSICQLLGRKSTFKLWGHIPRNILIDASPIPSLPFQKFELAKLGVRHTTFHVALWLLQDWPTRFIQTCLNANIYKSIALPNSVYAPKFFSDAIEKSLTRRQRNTITTLDVERTIEALSQKDVVTKKRVRKALGVQESKAIDALLNQRRQATLREFLLLCGAFEKLIKETSSARDQLATLKRDYLIFLISVLTQDSIETVCAHSKDEIFEILANPMSEYMYSAEKQLLCSRAKTLNEEYARYFSSRMDEESATNWFIGRFGDSLDGHSVRDRISKLVTKTIEGNLWNSADIFKYVLRSHKELGRRTYQKKYSGTQIQLF